MLYREALEVLIPDKLVLGAQLEKLDQSAQKVGESRGGYVFGGVGFIAVLGELYLDGPNQNLTFGYTNIESMSTGGVDIPLLVDEHKEVTIERVCFKKGSGSALPDSVVEGGIRFEIPDKLHPALREYVFRFNRPLEDLLVMGVNLRETILTGQKNDRFLTVSGNGGGTWTRVPLYAIPRNTKD